MKFAYNNNVDHFSFFFANENNERVPIELWYNLEKTHISQIAILKELFENGSAEFHDCEYLIDTRVVLNLGSIDRQILGLPIEYPFELLIEPEGMLMTNTFRFKYGFYDFCPNGTKFVATIRGGVLQVDNREYLLSVSQYNICKAIDDFNNLPEIQKGNVINLKKLSEIKGLAKDSGTILEHFLNNQSLYIPDKIKLDVDFRDGVLEILPVVDIDEPFKFTSQFDRLPNVREVYPISGSNGETTRIVISDEQKRELVKVKNVRRVSNKEKIREIIEHPELHFDEDNIDFNVFYSDRVKEIGLYKPNYYPFVSPYKSQWIPGIVIKDRVHGEKRIQFKTPDILFRFQTECEIAQKNGRSNFNWENENIPVEDAVKIIDVATKQFERPEKPVKNEKTTENEVLIIKENAEMTEYANSFDLPDNLKHNFSEISNIAIGIRLKDHQLEGISWMQSLYKKEFSGGLLADDMGLGKTLQLLYFIEWHYQHYNDSKPYLIVAPVSLLENWQTEYQRFFTPQSLPINRLFGSVSLTKENVPARNREDAKSLQSKQIILTNYEVLRNYQISLGLVDFAIIALDEAQKIKTPGTLITNACKALKSDFKIAMTGTPVENTLVDIWCIMDFAVPGLLGNAKDFNEKFQKPLKQEGTNVKQLTENLRESIGGFIKRRLKSDVAKDLPTKHDGPKSRIPRVMPSIQLERYKQEIEYANSSSSDGIEGRNQKLKSLWAIRDISDHPYLLECQILSFSVDELIKASAKLQTTIGILSDIKLKSEKAIIFADRKETQKMIQKAIYETFGIFASIINGDTPASPKVAGKSEMSRQQTIDRFQSIEGFNIIIMSPIAAGVGLNVTEANHIIHFTRHWNPAKEEQATDRAYRIGQTKDVFVYYPMAIFPDNMVDDNGKKLKSFDEVLDSMLDAKKALAKNTLFPTEQAEVTPDELFGNIFGRSTETKPQTVSLEDIDKLNPNLFEASIAAIYQKQGFEVFLTPYSHDKGADVAVIKGAESYLIQAKQSKSLVGKDAIQEICTAKRYYEDKFKVSFRLATITNNDYSPSAVLLAKSNDIVLFRRGDLHRMLNDHVITFQNLHLLESQRMTKV